MIQLYGQLAITLKSSEKITLTIYVFLIQIVKQLNRNFYSGFSLGLNWKDWKVIQYLTKRFHRTNTHTHTCIIVIIEHSPTTRFFFRLTAVWPFQSTKNLQPFAFDRNMTKLLLGIVNGNRSNLKACLISIILFFSFNSVWF